MSDTADWPLAADVIVHIPDAGAPHGVTLAHVRVAFERERPVRIAELTGRLRDALVACVAPAPRPAAFGGFLGLDDYVIADGLVTIDQAAGREARKSALSALGPDAVFLRGDDVPDALRSARPFALVSAGWELGQASRSAEEICREFAAGPEPPIAADEAGLPPGPVEAWLLPVTDFAFRFLIIPAGGDAR